MNLSKLVALLSATVALSMSHIAVAADDHKGHDHDSKKSGAHAHEAKPQYGGMISVVKDVNYELVARPDSMTLYVSNHGKPVDTSDASATLTLLSASDKTEVKLAPAGENKLQAKGNFKVDKGAKILASVTVGGKPQNVRFALK